MNIEEDIKDLKKYISFASKSSNFSHDTDWKWHKDVANKIQNLLTAYEKEKEKNKNKDKILRNIREEFLKYDWKNANPIQTYNQIKSLYESIYCKPYEE